MNTQTGSTVILIVDDDETDRAALRRLLKKMGVANTVVEADDGTVALGYLSSDDRFRHSVAVFLDLKMPLADGHDVLDVIQHEEAYRHVAVVVTSGSDDPRDLARSRELRAVEHLTKPVPYDELERVMALLEENFNVVFKRKT